MEQTYMNLKDKSIRPVLSINNLDKTNKSFLKIVDDYNKWSLESFDDEIYDSFYKESESHIIELILNRSYIDGYELAKKLESDYCIEPDSRLVEILDDISFVRDSLTTSLYKQWVKENFLEIPPSVLHQKVNAKQGNKKYENRYITQIYPETYKVTIHENKNYSGGIIINYENIELI